MGGPTDIALCTLLVILYIYTKFCENISQVFKVIEPSKNTKGHHSVKTIDAFCR